MCPNVQVSVVNVELVLLLMPGASVQRFAAAVAAFLVQAALAALHHVNEVGQRLLLVHGDVPEVAAHRLQQRSTFIGTCGAAEPLCTSKQRSFNAPLPPGVAVPGRFSSFSAQTQRRTRELLPKSRCYFYLVTL